MNERQMKQDIVQLSINTMFEKIKNIKSVIDNHPIEDKEFVDLQYRHIKQWEVMIEFVKQWQEEIK